LGQALQDLYHGHDLEAVLCLCLLEFYLFLGEGLHLCLLEYRLYLEVESPLYSLGFHLCLEVALLLFHEHDLVLAYHR
jgi:hypothetical protein